MHTPKDGCPTTVRGLIASRNYTTRTRSLQYTRRSSIRAEAFFSDLFPKIISNIMGNQSSKGQQNGRNGSTQNVVPSMSQEEIDKAAASLNSLQRDVAFRKGTERAFTGSTVNGYPHNNKQKGTYVGAVSGLPLFSSVHKFESGTGWPSFYQPVDPNHIIEVKDLSIPFMPRVEVIDARSGAHLGHGEC